MGYHDVMTDEVFAEMVNAPSNYSSVYHLNEYMREGRFWMVKSIGQSLLTTAKTMEGTKILAMFGITVRRSDLELCDDCHGYSFESCGAELGDEHHAFLWFCYDCKYNDLGLTPDEVPEYIADSRNECCGGTDPECCPF